MLFVSTHPSKSVAVTEPVSASVSESLEETLFGHTDFARDKMSRARGKFVAKRHTPLSPACARAGGRDIWKFFKY